MRVNKQIRVPKVRVIGADGNQIGIIATDEALAMAVEQELDLVEVVPTSKPPVCKIIDYGKFRYDQAKREKESKKAQHQVKVKEVKIKPNIDAHDFEVKSRRARGFLEQGFKVKLTCMFRGREMVHPEIGEAVVKRFVASLGDVASSESPAKRMGRTLTLVMAPLARKK